MAGGRGQRLHPLTLYRAKPAVPFGGIYRIIDFTLSNCINSGIRKIHVLTQYKSISLSRHIRKGWNIFDSELDEYIDVIPAQQGANDMWYQGTADSLYQNLDTMQAEDLDLALVLAGDHIYKMDYRKMIDFHITKAADATVGVIEIGSEKASGLGVIQLDRDKRITDFQEKPERPKTIPGKPGSICASMGIYIFNRKVLEEVLEEDAQNKASSRDFSKDVIPGMLGKKMKLYGFSLNDADMSGASYWRDIGSRDAYYEANMDLIRVTPEFNLYDTIWPVRTYQEHLPPMKTVFAEGAEEKDRCGRAVDSLVSAGCIISGGLVQQSILSPSVRVHSFAEVCESVIMDRAEIGRHAKIKRAILDKDVKILANARIGYDPEEDKRRFTLSKKGIAIIPKGTVVK